MLGLLVCLPLAAQVAPIPTPTALPGQPFFVKKSWPIGGDGNWDYLTLDAAARRLYIAHDHVVQVVDVDSGTLLGEIGGFREAHAIALDDTGMYGYVSDGPADAVVVFNRSSLKAEATISMDCSPGSLAYEPQSQLVFAVCGAAIAHSGGQPPSAHVPRGRLPHPPRTAEPGSTGPSHVMAIDAEKNTVIADLVLDGDFRFAQSDADGHVFFTVSAAAESHTGRHGQVNFDVVPPRIAKIDAARMNDLVRQQAGPASGSPAVFDWSGDLHPDGLLQVFPLPNSCNRPRGLAVDAKDLRLFAACENQQLLVLNASSGQIVTTLTTGPGDDVIGYDADRGLIYSANGGGYGSLTIVRQDAVADSYAVVQNLPTLGGARTLAVDPSTGNVYLVTDLKGVDLTKPGGIGTLRSTPVAGSFQVLVIGH